MTDMDLTLRIRVDGKSGKAEIVGLDNALRKTGDAGQDAGRKINAGMTAARQGVQSISQQLASMQRSLVGLATSWVSFQGGKAFLGQVATVQDLNTRLRFLTESGREYGETQEWLRGLAQRQHKDYRDLASAYSGLLALQKDGNVTQAESRQIMEGLSNAASAMGASGAQLQQVFFGLRQTLSADTLNMEDFRQVVDPLPGLFAKVADAAGMTMGEFKEQVAAGKITGEMFRHDLIQALEDYSGAADAAANNVNSKYQDIQNAWTRLVETLEQPVSDVVTPVLSAITRGVAALNAELNKTHLEKLQDQLSDARDDFKGAWFTSTRNAAGARIARTEADIQAEENRESSERIGNLYQELTLLDQKSRAVEKLARQTDVLSLGRLDFSDKTAAPGTKAKARPGRARHDSSQDDARQIANANLSQQREFLQLEEETLKGSFDRKAIDAGSYYQRLAALRDADFAAQINAKQQEAALSTDRGDQAKILSELAVLEAQRAQAAQSATQDLISAREKEKEQVETLLDAYDQQGAALRKLREDAEKFTQAMRNGLITPEQAKVFNEGFSAAWSKTVSETSDGGEEMSEYAISAARNMESAFADFLFDPFAKGTKSMAESFIDAIRRMAAEALSAEIFGFGRKDGAGRLASGLSDAGGGFYDWITGFFQHSGGLAGTHYSERRLLPAAAFFSAPRFHAGGFPGLRADEVPAVLQRGEEVLTRNDPRHALNGGRGGVEVHIHEAPGTRASAKSSTGQDGGLRMDVIIEQIEQSLSSNISRGGGIAPALERQYGLNRTATAVR